MHLHKRKYTEFLYISSTDAWSNGDTMRSHRTYYAIGRTVNVKTNQHQAECTNIDTPDVGDISTETHNRFVDCLP